MNFIFRNLRKINLVFLLITAVFCLFSCATNMQKDKRPFIWLADRSKFILLPAKDIEKPLDGYQRISASFAGQDYRMNTWVKADENGMDIVLLNEMGANMGELIFKDDGITFSSSVFPSSLSPEYIIADFQFCFFNASALNSALKRDGFSFFSGVVNEKEIRRIYKGDTLIIEITFNSNYIVLVNHLRGYTYTLEGDF